MGVWLYVCLFVLLGAIVSLLCVLFISYLFLTEFLSFLTVDTTSEMFVYSTAEGVHGTNEHEMITINMNITVPRIPCAGTQTTKRIQNTTSET